MSNQVDPQLMKFQTDLTGTMLLVYGKDHDPHIKLPPKMAGLIIDELSMYPMSKLYAEAHVDADGKLVVDPDTVLVDPDSWPDW